MKKPDGTEIEIESMFTAFSATCVGCGEDFTGGRFAGVPMPSELFCPKCQEKAREADLRAKREAKWFKPWHDRNGILREALCPKFYQQFDDSLFGGDREALATAKAWDPESGRGLVMWGHPGTGKTWALYELARGCLVERNMRIEIIHQQTLRRLAGLMSRSVDEYDYMLEQYCRAEVLFVDDPFKARLTARLDEAVFELINERYIAQRPTVLAMNGGAKTLFQFVSEDRVGPLKRRLAESCGSVPFKKGSQ